MNPPFGKRNGIIPWFEKIAYHDEGIALSPDRTSAGWFQAAARQCDLMLFVNGKIQFRRPDGSYGKQPGTGTTLFAYGERACNALKRAESQGLGFVAKILSNR